MTSIEWTRGDDGALGKTWNPVRGCSRVSPGCDACYAMRQARRFSGPGQPYEGLTRIGKRGVDWSGRVVLVPEQLELPLSWRKPRRIFVNSMSDLFHESLSNEQIAAVFGVMAACPQHTFQVLTKRAKRMREWFRWIERQPTGLLSRAFWPNFVATMCADDVLRKAGSAADGPRFGVTSGQPWPLPNVWLGASAEDQVRADERIPHLLATPAAVRFVSAEPLLGPLELVHRLGDVCTECSRKPQLHTTTECPAGYLRRGLDWVIVGGESGNGARPCHVDWIRSLARQCRDADVPFFGKQLGAHVIDTAIDMPVPYETRRRLNDRKGGDPSEWPEELRVRQFPEVRA